MFDAGALVQYFANNMEAVKQVDKVLSGREDGCVTHLALSELYYKTCQKRGIDVAKIRFASVINSKIRVIPSDNNLALEAGNIKCKHNSLSLADAYSIALCRKTKGALITTDTALTAVEKLNIVRIKF